jgi:uncharacterized protein
MDALLERRLDRLRAGTRPTNSLPARAGIPDHATPLADALGGVVVRAAGGAVVALEQSFDLAIDRRRLASLPYRTEVGQPLVCVDLETTGLATAAGTLAFLVGVGVWQDGRLRLHQLLLPDHSAEPALLTCLAELIPTNAWLVTYNGKCFDWPLLVARFRLHRRGPPPHAGHLDLLPVARQLWKHRLGGARLGLVEREVCGVERGDDLPGHEIPERYFAYLRSRDAGLLRGVVEHNRQDIVSMARILTMLASDLARPEGWPAVDPGDLLGLARAYARRGRHQEALSVLEAALMSSAWARGVVGGGALHRRLSSERAWLLGRVGRRDEAFVAWLEIARRGGPGAGIAWLHVARYREHVERDIGGALDACHQAAGIAHRARLWGQSLTAVEADLARRLPRLRRLAFRRRPLSRGVGRAA